MDAKKLKELVKQVAVVLDSNQIGPNGNVLAKPKPKYKKIVRIVENEFGDQEELVEEESNVNETLPWILKELKPIEKLCEIGCGKIIADQIVDKKFYHSPVPHWRTSCRKCQKAVGPKGELITGSVHIQNAYFKHFNYGKDK
jgi:hypothetical protein